MNAFLGWVVEPNTTSLQQVVAVLKTALNSRQAWRFSAMFEAMDHSLLLKKTERDWNRAAEL